MLHFRVGVPNYSENFNVSNKEIQHIKGDINHDKNKSLILESSHVDVLTSFGDNVVP